MSADHAQSHADGTVQRLSFRHRYASGDVIDMAPQARPAITPAARTALRAAFSGYGASQRAMGRDRSNTIRRAA